VTARFIAFEGGEGSGKSTQAARLAARLGAVLTREPGGTPLGARLRAVLLDPATRLTDRAEALLMAADRAQHVADVIRPELAAGRSVVTDRYIGSSLAYQGFGRGLPVDEVRWLSEWATGGLWPDLVVLLDVPAEVATRRLAGGRPDRLEAAGEAFHRRVGEGFRTLAAGDPHRWVVVDGTPDMDEVEERIWSMVTEQCPELAAVEPSRGPS
jgi:dTMP kinase